MILLQQGSFDYNLTITCGIDLTSATSIRVVLAPERGVPIIKDLPSSAILVPENGTIAVPIDEGDLDTLGGYAVQWADVSPGRFVVGPVSLLLVLPNVPGMARPPVS